MIIAKTYQDLKPVLMETGKIHGSLNKVKEPYYVIAADDQSIFVLASGLNGVEYNKTEGFLSKYEGVHIYQCLYGTGVILMQRNDFDGEAKEFKIITLNAGKHMNVPAGWLSCFVNIGKNLLVVLGNIDFNSKDIDTEPVLRKKGLAYYIVEKKGEIGFERNLNYKVFPQITSE